MSLQSDIADDLRRDEGFKAHPYLDTQQYVTIGFGFLIDTRRGEGIPLEIAELWLDYLIKRCRTELMDALPWSADQPHDVQRVLTELVYQLGLAGLLKFEKMLEALKNGARLNAAAELRDSKLYEQAKARTERHAKLIEAAWMGALELAQLWMVIRPIRLLRNRRRAKRGLPPLEDSEGVMPEQANVTMADGTQFTRTEPTIPLRSSSKLAVTGGSSILLLQLLQTIPWPWPWVDELLRSPAFASLFTLAVSYVTARFTKSPIQSQPLWTDVDAAQLTAVALIITAIGSAIASLASVYNLFLMHVQNKKLDIHGERLEQVSEHTNGLTAALANANLLQGRAEGEALGLQQGRGETKEKL